MTQASSNGDDLKQLLKEVIEEASSMDLSDVRLRRVRAVSKKRRAQLETELALLDAILSRLIETSAPAPAPVTETLEADSSVVTSEPSQVVDPTLELESSEAGRQMTLDEMVSPSDETPGTELEDALATQKTQLRTDSVGEVDEAVSIDSMAQHYRASLLPVEMPTEGWVSHDEILFDDALRLFRIGDSEGALVSLERLLLTSQLNDDLNEFIEANEKRLVELYEARIGPFTKIPIRMDDGEPMPSSFYEEVKVVDVLQVVDGRRSYEDILGQTSCSRLEGVMVLSQLIRLGSINTEIAPQ